MHPQLPVFLTFSLQWCLRSVERRQRFRACPPSLHPFLLVLLTRTPQIVALNTPVSHQRTDPLLFSPAYHLNSNSAMATPARIASSQSPSHKAARPPTPSSWTWSVLATQACPFADFFNRSVLDVPGLDLTCPEACSRSSNRNPSASFTALGGSTTLRLVLRSHHRPHRLLPRPRLRPRRPLHRHRHRHQHPPHMLRPPHRTRRVPLRRLRLLRLPAAPLPPPPHWTPLLKRPRPPSLATTPSATSTRLYSPWVTSSLPALEASFKSHEHPNYIKRQSGSLRCDRLPTGRRPISDIPHLHCCHLLPPSHIHHPLFLMIGETVDAVAVYPSVSSIVILIFCAGAEDAQSTSFLKMKKPWIQR